MHCSNCGSYVPPGVRFCSSCGSPTADPEATKIARTQSGLPESLTASDEIQHTVFTVRPTLIFIKLGYVLAILAAIALVFLRALIDVPADLRVPLALCLLLSPAYYHLKRNMIRYTVTDSTLEIDTGLFARTTRNIPLSKIQDVTVSASIGQRLLGFGDVIVDNASEVGGTTVLQNINNPRHYAVLLLRQLRHWH